MTADGRFRRKWIRRFKTQHGQFLFADGWTEPVDIRRAVQILVVDSASSRKDTPGSQSLTKKRRSQTVVTRWVITPDCKICLVYGRAAQVEMPGIIKMIREGINTAGGQVCAVCMELTTQSTHLFQACKAAGFPMVGMTTGSKDKITRSFDATNRMEQGDLYLPPIGPRWLQDAEEEVFTWTGDEEEPDDWVDCFSYAAIYLTHHWNKSSRDMPQVV